MRLFPVIPIDTVKRSMVVPRRVGFYTKNILRPNALLINVHVTEPDSKVNGMKCCADYSKTIIVIKYLHKKYLYS